MTEKLFWNDSYLTQFEANVIDYNEKGPCKDKIVEMTNKNTERNLNRFKMALASKVYNYMINIIFLSKVHDHQCGFKFWSCDFIKKEAKKIKDDHWFFDTEIILRSQKLGIVPYELPVKWTEQRSSKVKGSDINYFLSSIIKKFVSK